MIFGFDNWKNIYSNLSREDKYKIWIYANLSNNQDIYLDDYEEWLKFKQYIKDNKCKILKIGLRYRSHQVEQDLSCADGVYVVRSVKGEFGGPTKHCYTIGIVNNNIVEKTMWITPELIEEANFVDTLENCFEEALIIYEK